MPENYTIDTFKPSLISLIYKHEIDMWLGKFNCTLQQLRLAILAVGPEVEVVGAYLNPRSSRQPADKNNSDVLTPL